MTARTRGFLKCMIVLLIAQLGWAVGSSSLSNKSVQAFLVDTQEICAGANINLLPTSKTLYTSAFTQVVLGASFSINAISWRGRFLSFLDVCLVCAAQDDVCNTWLSIDLPNRDLFEMEPDYLYHLRFASVSACVVRLSTNSTDIGIYHSLGPKRSQPFSSREVLSDGDFIKPPLFDLVPVSRLIPKYTEFNMKTDSGTTNATFVGYTIDNNVVLRDGGNALHVVQYDSENISIIASTVPQDLSDDLFASDERQRLIFECIRTDRPNITDTLIANLTLLLKTKTIRGVPIYDLMQNLFNSNGFQYSLAVVGGTVRDLLQNKSFNDINDVDLAIGRPLLWTQWAIGDFFDQQHAYIGPRTVQAQGVRKDYGMIKVAKLISDPDALDVGILKGVPPRNWIDDIVSGQLTQDERTNHYLYGLSYVTDAQTRDLTMNAVYVEIFSDPPRVIDPTGRGLEDAMNQTIRFVNKKAYERDYGGWFRFWKEVAKGNHYEKNDARFSCTCISSGIQWILNATVPDTLQDSLEDLNAAYFFLKMRKKLITGNETVIPDKLAGWKANITTANVTECYKMWNQLVDLAKNAPFLALTMRGLAPELSENEAMLHMITALANQTTFPNTTTDQNLSDPEFVALDLLAVSNTSLAQTRCLFSYLTPNQLEWSSNRFERQFDDSESVSYDSDDDTDPEYASFPLWSDWQISYPDPLQTLYAHKLFLALTNASNVGGEMGFALSALVSANSYSIYSPLLLATSGSHDETANALAQLYHDPASIAHYLARLKLIYSDPASDSTGKEICDGLVDYIFAAVPDDVPAHSIVLVARIDPAAHARFALYDAASTPKAISDPLPSTTDIQRFLFFVYTGEVANISDESEGVATLLQLANLEVISDHFCPPAVMSVASTNKYYAAFMLVFALAGSMMVQL